MRLACHFDRGNRRSIHIARAMHAGAQALGITSALIPGFEQVCGTVGVAYGWGHPHLFEAYRKAAGHFVYVDLGWWDRKPAKDVLAGYHKVVVDGREPGEYFRWGAPDNRFAHFRLKIAPWRQTGHHILVAGMSEKSARTRGYLPQEWETAAVRNLQRIYPSRPILYRSKPSWPGASPIIGAAFDRPERPLSEALKNAWGVAACHSNVAVDALLAGIPIYVEGGVASCYSVPPEQWNGYKGDDGRAQLMADIAWCQWSPQEMATGACLRHLMERTPLCA